METETDEQVIATIPKGDHHQIRITLAEFKGYQIASLRIWCLTAAGAWRPGRSGFGLRVDLLPDLAAGVNRACDEARQQGLLGGACGDR